MRTRFFALVLVPVLSISASARQTAFVASGEPHVTIKEPAESKEGASNGSSGAVDGTLRYVGEHTLTPLAGGQSHLHFVLTRSKLSKLEDSAGEPAGELSAVDLFLFDSIKAAAASDVHDLIAIDQIMTKTNEQTRSLQLEHSIEVEGTEAAMRRVLEQLERFVAVNEGMVEVAITSVMAPVDSQSRGGGGESSARVSILDSAAYEAAISNMKILSADIGFMPTLTMYGAQKGEVSMLNQTSYVADFELSIAGDAMIGDPVIEVATDGFRVGVTPILDPDGKRIHLVIETWIASLKRPIRAVDAQIMGGTKITLQRPELVETKWSSQRLTIGPADAAIRVDGIRFTEFDDDGTAKPREMHLLLAVKPSTARAGQRTGEVVGSVLGVDGSNGKVFVQIIGPAGDKSRISADRISIYRDDQRVGECTLLENLNGVLVMKLVQGEAKAGDSVK